MIAPLSHSITYREQNEYKKSFSQSFNSFSKLLQDSLFLAIWSICVFSFIPEVEIALGNDHESGVSLVTIWVLETQLRAQPGPATVRRLGKRSRIRGLRGDDVGAGDATEGTTWSCCGELS